MYFCNASLYRQWISPVIQLSTLVGVRAFCNFEHYELLAGMFFLHYQFLNSYLFFAYMWKCKYLYLQIDYIYYILDIIYPYYIFILMLYVVKDEYISIIDAIYPLIPVSFLSSVMFFLLLLNTYAIDIHN